MKRSTTSRHGPDRSGHVLQGAELALEARNVCIDYVNNKHDVTVSAVRSLSLTVRRGEFVSVVGPSGCGKTTFLKAAAGLRNLSAGTIEVFSDGALTPTALVPQSPTLLPWRTVLGNIRYGSECLREARKSEDQSGWLGSVISLVGLEGFEHFYPHQLSGGMQQRVNLARGLAVESAVLLLDEPFASLDAQLRERMQVELMHIMAETKRTTILVTHQVDEAVYLADRVVVMSHRPGRVVDEIVVNLQRPRDLSQKRQEAFMEYCDRIWSSLGDPAQEK